jgi:hypothetical protein
MTIAAAWLHKKEILLLALFFIAFSAFTTDVPDLREELYLLSCPYSPLENDVTTGLTSNHTFKPEQITALPSVQRKVVVKITFLHLLPYAYRAPPSWS